MIIFESRPQECPVTFVKYSHNGRVTFACWQNGNITIHLSENALPISSFDSTHKGSVMSCGVSSDSSQLFATDYSGLAIIWDTQTGKVINYFSESTLLESSHFSPNNDNILLYSLHKKFQITNVYNIIRDLRQNHQQVSYIAIPNCRISKTIFLDDFNIISALDTGHIIRHDLRNSLCSTMENSKDSSCLTKAIHSAEISHITSDASHTIFMTSSKDKKAKIFDGKDLDVFLDLNYGEAANGCAVHPNLKLCAIVGGQDVLQVTTTAHKSNQFATKFFYLPTGEICGQIKSHFGTPNTCDFSPFGDSFASGAIDGFLKIHDLKSDDNFKSYENNLLSVIRKQINVLQS